MQVYYDDCCRLCRQFVRVCTRYDSAQRITYLPLSSASFPSFEHQRRAQQAIACLVAGNWYYGDATIVRILRALPRLRVFYYLIWPFWKLGISAVVYRYIANRRCSSCKLKLP